ncbi:hypothetical protein OROHE_022269 [Orobanche hederae]
MTISYSRRDFHDYDPTSQVVWVLGSSKGPSSSQSCGFDSLSSSQFEIHIVMLSTSMRNLVIYLLIERSILRKKILCFILAHILIRANRNKNQRRRLPPRPYTMLDRIPGQVARLNRLYFHEGPACFDNPRIDRNTFAKLCFLLSELGGLRHQRYMTVEEQVSMFLSVLGHHKKQRVIRFDHHRSVNPTPIGDDSTDPRWKWFKGCLGALDGTYVDVHVSSKDRPRYRTRKGKISTNVLGVCDTRMRFVYLLPGWEGSAADSRALRDAVTRPNGLQVPKGNYYLCDNGYANSEGFLVPFRGCRYHLNEWGPTMNRPSNAQEHFNMRHTRARNVIEHAFGVLKMRFPVLGFPTYYPIKTQIRLIMSCFLLHNFSRNEMEVDPIDELLDQTGHQESDGEDPDIIDMVESSPEFNQFREELADSMYNIWTIVYRPKSKNFSH